jgi:hypothetical protein
MLCILGGKGYMSDGGLTLSQAVGPHLSGFHSFFSSSFFSPFFTLRLLPAR